MAFACRANAFGHFRVGVECVVRGLAGRFLRDFQSVNIAVRRWPFSAEALRVKPAALFHQFIESAELASVTQGVIGFELLYSVNGLNGRRLIASAHHQSPRRNAYAYEDAYDGDDYHQFDERKAPLMSVLS